MAPTRRPSSAPAPLNFEHPYLDGRTKRPQKRELGIIDLVVFKMFGCFTPDDLPPPNPNATVYQAGAGAKSSSSSLTFNSGATTTTTTATPASAPAPAEDHAASAKRRLVRSERVARNSAWADDKVLVPDAKRAAVERTQFVEQRVEERRRDAERRLREERSRAAEQAAESSAQLAGLVVTPPMDTPDDPSAVATASTDMPAGAPGATVRPRGAALGHKSVHRHRRAVSGASSIDRLFPLDRDGGASVEDVRDRPPPATASDRASGEAADDAGDAGRVSRLSAMFEQP